MYLQTGIFLWTKEESKRRSLTLSGERVRELAPMTTARHWCRDSDDEASASSPSPTHHAHPRGEKRHSPSHKDTAPQRGTGPGQQAGPWEAGPAIPT